MQNLSEVGCSICPMWKKPKRGAKWDGSLPDRAVTPTFESYTEGGIMLVGEAPGGVEEEKGVPMVGPAGRIARAAIRTLDLPQPAITNAALCRPMKGQRQ